MRSLLVLAVPFFLLVSGCVGSGAGSEASVPGQKPGSVVSAGGLRDDGATISGLVLDDSESPLEGAQVGILELQLIANTDTGGLYEFTNVAPGAYNIAASRLGYEAQSRRVNVEANGNAPVTFRLEPIAVEVVRYEINGPFDGFFTCKMGLPTQSAACGSVLAISFRTDDILWANDRAFQWFNMTSDNYRTFIGELTWQQGTFATSTKLRTSFSHERFGSHWFCSAEGANPLLFRFEKAAKDETPECTGGSQGGQRDPAEPSMTKPLVVGFRVPFGSTSGTPPNPVYLAFQQRVTSWITVFYGAPPDMEWHARPDA